MSRNIEVPARTMANGATFLAAKVLTFGFSLDISEGIAVTVVAIGIHMVSGQGAVMAAEASGSYRPGD